MGNNSQKSVFQGSGLRGQISIPADKSISHRSLMFGALGNSKIKISNLSMGEDCVSTLKIIQNLGCEVEFLSEKSLMFNPPKTLTEPSVGLDCGNSGTSMRLFCGLLSGYNFSSTLFGDASLTKRPMKRVIEPLTQMGAKIFSNDYKAPLKIEGGELFGIEYSSPIPSAQVKSCLLLAGLKANGQTIVYEKELSRNHSEIMLKYLGADIETGKCEKGYFTKIKSSSLRSADVEVVGDISSAAFFMVAAAIVRGSDIIIKNVGLNPTRTGILEVFDKMGVNYEILDKRLVSNEEAGDIRVKYSPDIVGCDISGDIIPKLIDEIPIIAVLASFANGETVVSNAQDLRNKESDRISALGAGLKKLGINFEEKEDGFIIGGKNSTLKGNVELETHHDHRLAMSYFVAGLRCESEILIKNFSNVNTSFPEFLTLFNIITS